MTNIFQIAVERLVDLGVYNFLLPFILFSTVLYAVLRKTKILGESPMIHGIISVIVGLFVFGAPVIIGTSITASLTAFLTQGAIVIVVLIIALLIASFFYPNIMEKLPEIFKAPGPGGLIIWVTLGIASLFGVYSLFGSNIKKITSGLRIPGELGTLTVVIVVIFIVFLLVAQSVGKEVK